MRRSEQSPAGSGGPGCPDLLRHVGGPRSPLSPLYLSFFEEECRAITARLRLAAAGAAEPSPVPGEANALWPSAAGPVTSTPLRASPPLDEGAPGSARPAARPSTHGRGAAAAARDLAGGVPGCLPQPAAGGSSSVAPPGSRLARPPARSRKVAQRGAGQPPCGAPGPEGRPRNPAPCAGRGTGRVPRARASLGVELPKAGKGPGAPGTRLPQPLGTKLKPTLAAKSRFQHPRRALQLAQPSAIPKPTPGDTKTETAVKVEGHRQPFRRLSTAIPTMASCSQLQPLGKVASPKHFCIGLTAQDLMCNRTQELKENVENKEQLVVAGTVLGAGKADQTWVCVGSSFSSELATCLAPGCENAVPAEQSAGDQLSQELKRVKNELELVKSELANKTAQCEAYLQTISSLQAQLRAAGICPEDAAVEESGDSGRH